MITRPGPSRLPPGQAPGGLVFQIYNRAGTMLVNRMLHPSDSCDESAKEDAIATLGALRAQTPAEICLVCFDGDTGLRWTQEDWDSVMEWASRS